MHRFILFLFALVLGLETGAALFTSVVVYPVWTASPEIVATWQPSLPYFMQEGDFFKYCSSTTMLLSIIVLVAFARRRSPERPWALVAAGAFLAVAIWTFAYFLPIQDVVQGDPAKALPRAEVASILETFVTLNWIRQLLLWIALPASLHALGLAYRAGASPDAATVPIVPPLP